MRRFLVLPLLVMGALGLVALSAPAAMANCPACEEYIWSPPDPRGGSNGAPSGGPSGGGEPGGPSSGAAGSAGGALSGGPGGRGGGDATRFGATSSGPEISDSGAAGATSARTPAAGAGVLSAGASAGGTPVGLIVLAAAALIGLAGFVAVRRSRRRRIEL